MQVSEQVLRFMVSAISFLQQFQPDRKYLLNSDQSFRTVYCGQLWSFSYFMTKFIGETSVTFQVSGLIQSV